MINTLTPVEGMLLAIVFGLTMLILVFLRRGKKIDAESFLVANRTIPMWQGACSIAVSWVWAPAIFVCSMQAYQNGLPGIFWFTVPNIVCFFVFAVIANKLRTLSPNGFTIPEYVGQKFPNSNKPHLIFLTGHILNMLAAVVANAYAGGALLSQLTNINISTAIIMVSAIALSYSLISGLKASIITDVVQLIMVLGLICILVPWTLFSIEGGITTVISGLSGHDKLHGNLFDLKIAWYLGVPMTITLIAGPLADQMFIQRTFAVRQKDITKTFVYGGLLFGIIPIMLSTLGFIAASWTQQGILVVTNPELVGPQIISMVLPKIGLYAFTLMTLAALCSTLDSALCAVSSFSSIDIYKKYINHEVTDVVMCKIARIAMCIIAILGTAIALLEPSMLWTFLITGCITGSLFFPTIYVLYSKSINAKYLSLSIATALVISIPLSIYANIVNNQQLIVWASLSSVVISILVLLLGCKYKNNNY